MMALVLLSGCTFLAQDFNGYYGQVNAIHQNYNVGVDDFVPLENDDIPQFNAELREYKNSLSQNDSRDARAMALLIDIKIAYANMELNLREATEAISNLGEAPTCDASFRSAQDQFNDALGYAESAYNKSQLFNSTYEDFKEIVVAQEGFDPEETLEAKHESLREVSQGLAAICS